MIDYSAIEKKWQKAWEEAKIFEPEPSEKRGILITAALPYVNAPAHIGHFRTYSTADTYARYMRMKGLNALYPFAFHATGTPVLAFAKRLANNDRELVEELRIFHVADEDIAKMSDPVYISDYFIKRQEADFRRAGLGIDWRRKFITTEPLFSKLVEWQFNKLKELGYLVKGKHPVGWCPSDNHAVGQHDTMHDVHPKIEEVIGIKFKDTETDISFLCVTYRPETIYGVTNIFINDKEAYVVAKIDGSSYYLSKKAAETLKYQFDISLEKEVTPGYLLSRKAINPITQETVPVLPGFFVKTDVGTGVVMSVPAHAPFDYAALERLKVGGYPVPKAEYKRIIEIPGEKEPESKKASVYEEIPALAHLQLLNADQNATDQLLELATRNIYREEARRGIMLAGKYKGKSEPEAREGLKEDLLQGRNALRMMIIANEEPVYCRDGTRVVVNMLTEQWFIDYGNEEWKKKVRDRLKKIMIYPEKYRNAFEGAIDWIDLRATERAQGLGTRFPFNPNHIIESLSDSTIYMLFYTFDYIIRGAGIKPEQLTKEFFDYILCSIGNISDVSQKTGIDISIIKKCEEQLEYWYVNTSRHSAFEHIYNHFTMYIFNHVALLPEKFAPKQIVVNGMLNYEGDKMSKSLGNVVPLIDGVEKYGSDPMRFIEIATADLEAETNFTIDGINSVCSRNEYLLNAIDKLDEMSSSELSHIDYWLYSRLNSKIMNATASMDLISFRSAYNEVFYNSVSDLRWYFERVGHNELVVREFLEKITLMLGPIMPHVAEEFWHELGKNTLVAKEKWPTYEKRMISPDVEATEQTIMNTMEDINSVMGLTAKMPANSGKKVRSIRIIIADDWKTDTYNSLTEKKSISDVMKNLTNPAEKERASKFLSQFASKLKTLERIPQIKAETMLAAFSQASAYLSKRFNAEIAVELESASKSQRASRAIPGRPSIEVIWS